MYGYTQTEEALRIEKALRKAWDGQQVIYYTTKDNLRQLYVKACKIQERLKQELGEASKQGSFTIQVQTCNPHEAYFSYRYEEAWKRWKDKDRQYTWTPNSKEKIWTPDNETEQQGRLS